MNRKVIFKFFLRLIKAILIVLAGGGGAVTLMQ